MAAQLDGSTWSEGSKLAFERFRAAAEGRVRGYPHGAIFVPSDAPHTRKTLLRALKQGQPIVLVFPDGQERIVRGEPQADGGWLSGMRERLVSLRGLLLH